MNRTADSAAARARTMEIVADDAGQRIDNFLLRCLKGVPRSHIYRILRRGEVRVNRGRIRPEYRLRAGDRVRIPPLRRAERSGAGPQARRGPVGEILYEDERLLILNKPAGVAVHGGSGIRYGVIEALRAARPEAPYLELVHRLDRDTSGCLLIAKRRSELRSLHELLRGNAVEKRYLALVKGAWRGSARSVEAALRKNQLQGGERMVRVDAAGKAARTHFTPLAVTAAASLLEASPATGRTHQIRVHAAHAGHPLAGDEKYGDAEFNREMRDRGLRRLFLHARAIAFSDPRTGRGIRVEAPLAEDLRPLAEELYGKEGP